MTHIKLGAQRIMKCQKCKLPFDTRRDSCYWEEFIENRLLFYHHGCQPPPHANLKKCNIPQK